MAVHLVAPPVDQVDASPRTTLGSTYQDEQGNEFTYGKGVASTAAGDAVVFDANYATTRTVAASRGPVGFAQGPILANQYGWYLTMGRGLGNGSAAIAANAALYLTATPGAVDDTVAAGGRIEGAYAAAAAGGAGPVSVILTQRPFAGGLG
jgi:hypothetical protein